MADGNENPQNRYKRKRKKTVLQNARKYGKKGFYGRGSQLDEDTYQYFVRIMEVYKEGFPSDEEKLLFVNNVFEQIENTEVDCSCNQLGCRVIETLLPFANDTVLEKFMNAMSSDLRPICSDRFASHVIETLLRVACDKTYQTENENVQMYKDFTIKISKFLLNNLEDYVWDTYGNHIIRTAIESMAHLPKEDNKTIHTVKTENAVVKQEDDVPDDYKEIVKSYALRLIAWPQFNDLPHKEITSGLLQTILKTTAKLDHKRLKMYLKKLTSETFSKDDQGNEESAEDGTLPKAFLSKPVTMLLETSLQVATPKLFTKIYEKCFVSKLALLSATRNTNFAVQKLCSLCTDKTQYEAMFDEVADHFKDILDAGHSGVILALAQTCKRLSAKQGSFIQSLVNALNCQESEQSQKNLIFCVCKLIPHESLENFNVDNLQKEKLNLHGTLILQLMLEFNKPIKLVNSILNLDANTLKNLFSNTMGSHIVDSYVRSQYVGEKSREKLVRKMQGTYQELAATKFGSRSFEAIWNAASLKLRGAIMDELCYKDATWSNTEFGRIIASKTNLSLYKRNKEDWNNSFNKVSKTKTMFEDILK